MKDIIDLCDSNFIDFEVIILPREIDILTQKTSVIYQEKIPILVSKKEPLQYVLNKLFKRGFDIVFSLFVILTIFPWLLPIIAGLIKLESTGPIFFVQDRTGYWNKTFRFLKFRSMFTNKDFNPAKQACRQDDRVTRVGAFLRKTSLDELPQFFNVLKGDMSVVGPRPHMVEHTKEYAALIDTYMIRHKIKPGITGWAQINGHRGPTETLDKMQKRVQHDIYYIKNWTFSIDIKCIIITVANMIFGEDNAV